MSLKISDVSFQLNVKILETEIPSLAQWPWSRSNLVRGDPVREHGGGSLTGYTKRKTTRDI